MYTTQNFKTKKALREAVSAYNASQQTLKENAYTAQVGVMTKVYPVTIFAPGLGQPVTNGWDCVEGPHYPQPHRWYARVRLVDGVVVEVK